MSEIDRLIGLRGQPAAHVAAKVGIKFWIHEVDQRGLPLMQPLHRNDPNNQFKLDVIVRPHAGRLLFVYCAELPWDASEDGPQPEGSALAWCVSNIYPDGELGMIHPGWAPKEYMEITRQDFKLYAAHGWPGPNVG